jgi:hypothetical protein
MALSQIQEFVERSFNEAIRVVLVQEGYLVDETLLVGNPNAEAIYKAGMEAIANTKGFCVELYGAASNQARGELRVPRIVLESERMGIGVLGSNPSGQVVVNPLSPQTFQKVKTTSRNSQINIAAHLVSKDIRQDRVLNAVIIKALGLNGYLPLYGNPGEVFFINQLNFYDIPEFDQGLIEKVYEYEAPDLFIEETIMTNNIVPINQIDLEIKIPDDTIPNNPNVTVPNTDAGGITSTPNNTIYH